MKTNFHLNRPVLVLSVLFQFTCALLLNPWLELPSCVSFQGMLAACTAAFCTTFVNSNVFIMTAPLTGGTTALSLLPEIFLSAVIVALLLTASVELVAGRAPKVLAIEYWRISVDALLLTALLYAVYLLGSFPSSPVLGGHLFVSWGCVFSKFFITLVSAGILHLSENYIREHTRNVLEFSIIILLAVLLTLVLVAANNFMTVFLALAGLSLTLYILVIYDVADAACREAAVKYFYLSTLSAGLIAFGLFLIFSQFGSLDFAEVSFLSKDCEAGARHVLSVATCFILVGFLFKLSAFPAHLWAVEVYEGSPMPVTTFFLLPVKIAVFLILLRITTVVLDAFSFIWIPIITAAGVGSLLWGAFAAAHERKIIRLMGYASINQIGYLLLGLAAESTEGLRATYFYLFLYVVTTGGFFLILTNIRREDNSNFTYLSDFRGLGKTDPFICWTLSVVLFSMAGIPPLAGFFGKFYLVSALVAKVLYIPAVVALGVSLLTAYYYLRIIKTFWFEEPIAENSAVVLLSKLQRVLLSLVELAMWVTALLGPVLIPFFGAAIDSYISL